jgi:hypothetical protein
MIQVFQVIHEKGGRSMKAGLIYTSTGPIVIVTSFESLEDPILVKRLSDKGITKYIAYELPYDEVAKRYGGHFSTVMGDRKQNDELRVIDFEGHSAFNNFSLCNLGQPICHEAEKVMKAA